VEQRMDGVLMAVLPINYYWSLSGFSLGLDVCGLWRSVNDRAWRDVYHDPIEHMRLLAHPSLFCMP
jgi:hypothetical protein